MALLLVDEGCEEEVGLGLSVASGFAEGVVEGSLTFGAPVAAAAVGFAAVERPDDCDCDLELVPDDCD